MRPGLLPLESDDRTLFAHVGNVLVACSHDRETPHTFELLERHVRHVGTTQGGTVGLLFVVVHQKGPPPGFVERASESLKRTEDTLSVSSCALLAEGFVASVYRSMAAMLLTLVGRRDRLGVHGSLEDACTWLVARMPTNPSTPDSAALATEARRVVEQTRRP